MMADCDMVARLIDQADLYYRHNSGIGAYFESFAQKKFGSGPESIGISKKNQGGFSNLDYIYLRIDH